MGYLPEWIRQELEELGRAKLGVFVFMVAGALLGFWAGSWFYSERIAILEERLKDHQQESAVTPAAPAQSGPVVQGPVLIGYGTDPPNCGAEINGAALMDFREKYEVGIVCGLEDPRFDRFEDLRVTASHGYTITPTTIRILAPYSQRMKAASDAAIEEVRKTIPPDKPNTLVQLRLRVWHEVTLLPKGFDVASIRRLSDVSRYGGMVLSQLK
ncbi:MAG: hypothetical protein HY655_06190 [Acidobacteria bacterium]|nr:hypothetical protein [Acidobacteriota bacterium]